MTLLMIESAVLALAGGAFGTLVAQWGIDLFAATLGKPEGQGWLNFAIDGRVLLFSFAVSLITALLFGLVPAIGATRLDLRGVLLEDAPTAGIAPRGRRLRAVLVATRWPYRSASSPLRPQSCRARWPSKSLAPVSIVNGL